MTDEDPNEFLMGGGGAPVAKFPSFGTTVSGVILHSKVNQQTDLDQKLKYYDDGNPMKQLVITLQTQDRDPAIPNDDGRRRLFVKNQMKGAVTDAIEAAGSTLHKGATLTVTYVADAPSSKKGYHPAHQYSAVYSPAPNGGSTASQQPERQLADNEAPF